MYSLPSTSQTRAALAAVDVDGVVAPRPEVRVRAARQRPQRAPVHGELRLRSRRGVVRDAGSAVMVPPGFDPAAPCAGAPSARRTAGGAPAASARLRDRRCGMCNRLADRATRLRRASTRISSHWRGIARANPALIVALGARSAYIAQVMDQLPGPGVPAGGVVLVHDAGDPGRRDRRSRDGSGGRRHRRRRLHRAVDGDPAARGRPRAARRGPRGRTGSGSGASGRNGGFCAAR